jgi:hypothetical protein
MKSSIDTIFHKKQLKRKSIATVKIISATLVGMLLLNGYSKKIIFPEQADYNSKKSK